MAWRVFGEWIPTAGATDLSVYQKFKTTNNKILVAVRTWFVFYNDPSVTSIALKIYSNNGGSPGKLLYTSNSLTKSTIITSANGVRECYFEFNSGNGVHLKGGDYYHLVFSAVGYTGDSSAHIAWMKAYPDPVYTGGWSTTHENLGIAPYQMSFVGASL